MPAHHDAPQKMNLACEMHMQSQMQNKRFVEPKKNFRKVGIHKLVRNKAEHIESKEEMSTKAK